MVPKPEAGWLVNPSATCSSLDLKELTAEIVGVPQALVPVQRWAATPAGVWAVDMREGAERHSYFRVIHTCTTHCAGGHQYEGRRAAWRD